MIHLTLIPKRPIPSMEEPTEISVHGDTLSICGRDFDLSSLGDGESADHPVLGKVDRDGDNYFVVTSFNVRAGCPDFESIVVGALADGDVDLTEYAICSGEGVTDDLAD